MDGLSLRIGLFGAGNMGGTVLKAFAAEGNHDIKVYDIDPGRSGRFEALTKTGKVSFCQEAAMCAADSELLIFAIKPYQLDALLTELKNSGNVKSGAVLLSVAAGVPSAKYLDFFPDNPVVRTMPNLPALVSAGYTGVCFVNMEAPGFIPVHEEIMRVFNSIGVCEEFKDESRIDKLIPVTSSSPAYICLLIEAMADGAVRLGFTRQDAYLMCAQAVLGTAEYIKQTGIHPAQLKDMVCSPAGTTIEAVAALEADGFRAAVLDAMEKCYRKVDPA